MSAQTKISEDKFRNKWGFIISCIGSAVGIANIWMFPYRIGEFGGSAFLIPYLIFVFLIGSTGVIGEMAFGRAMQTGPLGAFQKAFDRKSSSGHSKIGTVVGLIPVIGSLGIAVGYSVIIGWIIKFLVDSIDGSILKPEDPAGVFAELSQDFGSVPWHMLGLLLALLFMSFGIARGIETVNKIIMPAFFCDVPVSGHPGGDASRRRAGIRVSLSAGTGRPWQIPPPGSTPWGRHFSLCLWPAAAQWYMEAT